MSASVALFVRGGGYNPCARVALFVRGGGSPRARFPNDPSMMPVNDKIAALVTAMHSTNITHTMCDGKWLMKDRQVLTINEEEVLAEAQVRADAVYKRAGITLRERFPVERPVVSNI